MIAKECAESVEIVAIDDGSSDDTFGRLAKLQASDSPHLKSVNQSNSQ